jgi:hypothetical protein
MNNVTIGLQGKPNIILKNKPLGHFYYNIIKGTAKLTLY